jgi:hypothetical protein
MKPITLLLLAAMSGTLALVSTGCTATEGRNSNVSMLMPGTAPQHVNSNADQDFYQPPRNPQFNTARDQ